MGIEISGRLHTVFETNRVSERFTKREFVVELADNPKYPQLVLFQLSGDRCSQLDHFKVGDDVRIEFSLRGREWKSPKGETKYFNSLDVWRLEPGGAPSARGGGGSGGGGRGRGGGRSADPRDGENVPLGDEPSGGDGYGRGDDDLPF